MLCFVLLLGVIVTVYRGLAKCAAALRRSDEARDAFVHLLVIDPEYYVSSDASAAEG